MEYMESNLIKIILLQENGNLTQMMLLVMSPHIWIMKTMFLLITAGLKDGRSTK